MANATRYFDLTPAANGFGTLTGAWDTTTANWTASSTGASSTNVAYTFDNTDIAAFGSATTAPTAGTATIAASLNVTVNQVVTANMSGVQTIAAGAGGSLTLAGTTPTINVGSSGGLTISAPVNGTAGFTKSGNNTLALTGSTAGLTGTISMNQTTAGLFYLQGTAYSNLTNGTTFSLTGPADYGATNGRTFGLIPTTATSTLAAGVVFSGTGAVQFEPNIASTGAGHTFPAGALASLTGTSAPSTTGFLAPSAGFVQSLSTYTIATNIVTAADLPSLYSFYFFSNGTTTNARTLFYNGVAATYGTRFDLVSGSTTASTMSAAIYANHASGTLTLTGGITRYEQSGQTRTITLTLRGNSEAIETGNITQVTGAPYGSGVLAITKADANRWILSGSNTYTGTTTISAGTLVAASTSAFGSSAAGANVTVVASATMALSHATGINLTKTSATINLQGGTVKNELGDNTVTASTSPLTVSATTFDIAAGSLAWTPTISGTIAAAISKTGSGTLKLDNTANSYTGTTTITAGTLEITKIASVGGGNSSLGAPTTSAAGTISMAAGTTLKHTGTAADTTDRIISVSAAGTLTIDSSGSGSGALSLTTTNSGAITVFATGSSTLVFTGTNTAANTCARTLANPTSSGTTAVTKSGSNTWNLTGTLSHTGITTVEAGELQLGATNRTLPGGVAISGGTLSNSTNTLDANVTMTGGTLTAPLAGTGTLTINSGSAATMQPNAATGSNAQTGAITVSAGALVRLVTPDAVDVSTAGNGRAIGNGDVTCAGTIRTATSSTSKQKGQARYKSLTLNNGARIEVGAA